ncbi:MAG TPA: hypothetical protein VL992_20720 [Tepidisphaeraceae bacterium]|nr:hypothetical protein [Tepidisphaeraceae bacterium]
MSKSRILRHTLLAVGGGVFFAAHNSWAQANFTEPLGNNFSGGPETDMSSCIISNGASSLNFLITLNPAANIITNNYVNYEMGFQMNGGVDGQTLVAGSYGTDPTDVNPYGQQVGISTGENYWIGAYCGGSGYSGEANVYSFDTVAGWTYQAFSDLDETNNTIFFSLPLSAFNLTAGSTFNFDLWTTFGNPGGQSAYDALDASSNLNNIPNYSPYSNANVAGSPTPYDSATEPGSLFSTTDYTVTQGSAWSAGTDGDWSSAANWSNGVPNGAGVGVELGGAGASTSVTLEVPETVGGINFDNSNNYTLSGSGTLTLAGGVNDGRGISTAQIVAQLGSQQISLPLNLASPTNVVVVSGASLAISGNISGTGSLSLAAGSLTLSGANSYSGGTTINPNTLITLAGGALAGPIVNNGTLDAEANSVAGNISGTGSLVIGATAPTVLQLAAGGGASTVGSLTINTGSALDLTNNALIINYGANSDPISTIVSDLQAGFANNWSGTSGIISSALASSGGHLDYSIGYADGADGLISSLSSGEIEILPTLAGDAKLQGNVVFGDFQILAQYFGQSGTTWDEGDFTYNGSTTFGDFQLLAQDFGSGSGFTAGELASLNQFAGEFGDRLIANAGGGFSIVPVPEPTSIGLGAVAAFGLLARRRRSRQ